MAHEAEARVEVRRAGIVVLSREMVGDVVRIHREAFGGYMNTRLGDRYLRAYVEWFLRASRNISLAALDGGGAVGYVIGAPAGWDSVMNRDLLWVAAGAVARRPWLMFDPRIRRTVSYRMKMLLGTGFEPPPQPALAGPTMSLVGIGVSPAGRGRGWGVALLQAFEEKARAEGMRSMNLSVYPDNATARGLYEKCGWVPFVAPAREGESMFYTKVLD